MENNDKIQMRKEIKYIPMTCIMNNYKKSKKDIKKIERRNNKKQYN